MDAFLITFLLTALTQLGDRTQVLAAGLSIRFANRTLIIAGCALASAVNCALSAYAGILMRGWIEGDALILFYALALLFAGIGMLAWRRPVDMLENWPFGPFLAPFIGLFVVQFGDKGQFLIGAMVANNPGYAFATFGGWAGIMMALIPAILLQERLAALLPIKTIRTLAGAAFLLAGIYNAFAIWGWM